MTYRTEDILLALSSGCEQVSPCVFIKVRLWAHTDLPDEHKQAGTQEGTHQMQMGLIMIEIVPGPHICSSVCVRIDGGGHGVYVSAPEYSQPRLAGVPPANVFSFGSCTVDMGTDMKVKRE